MDPVSQPLSSDVLLVSLVSSAPARRIKSRPNRMSPDEPGRAPERSACKCPWLTTAMTISARLISRARTIVVFMAATIGPQAINLLLKIAAHCVKTLSKCPKAGISMTLKIRCLTRTLGHTVGSH